MFLAVFRYKDGGSREKVLERDAFYWETDGERAVNQQRSKEQEARSQKEGPFTTILIFNAHSTFKAWLNAHSILNHGHIVVFLWVFSLGHANARCFPIKHSRKQVRSAIYEGRINSLAFPLLHPRRLTPKAPCACTPLFFAILRAFVPLR